MQRNVEIQIIVEEWSENLGETIPKVVAAETGLHWSSVGTPQEPEFRTMLHPPVRHPGHNGTLRDDHRAPQLSEYGPFENQDAREKRMTQNVIVEMESYESGIFVVGIAHMHSMFEKLLQSGFKVFGYSCL